MTRPVSRLGEASLLDALDGQEGPAVPIKDGALQALAQSAVKRLPRAMPHGAPPARRGELIRLSRGALLAAGVVAATTAAAATYGVPWVARQLASLSQETPPSPAAPRSRALAEAPADRRCPSACTAEGEPGVPRAVAAMAAHNRSGQRRGHARIIQPSTPHRRDADSKMRLGRT